MGAQHHHRSRVQILGTITFMVQLWAAVTPARQESKTTQWLGGRPILMAADRKRWLFVSMPSSAVTMAMKNSSSPSLSSAGLTEFLRTTACSMPSSNEHQASLRCGNPQAKDASFGWQEVNALDQSFLAEVKPTPRPWSRRALSNIHLLPYLSKAVTMAHGTLDFESACSHSLIPGWGSEIALKLLP